MVAMTTNLILIRHYQAIVGGLYHLQVQIWHSLVNLSL